MSKQIQEAYVVSALRTAVGKYRGAFGAERPDDLLAFLLKNLLTQNPSLDPTAVDDVVIGCAMPEAEQGLNVARTALLLAGYPVDVPGVTVNRFCASGLQSTAMAADRIRLGEADVMVAGGVESMSLVAMGGNKPALNPRIFEDDNVAIAFGMGITAEKVAEQYQVSRDQQDAYALESHKKACHAIDHDWFTQEILPYPARRFNVDEHSGATTINEQMVAVDEGPRRDTSAPKLAKLKPVFAADGSVTAGNSSQVSDGAGVLLLASEAGLKEFNLQPIARFIGYAVAGVKPEIMGIGPIKAMPKLLQQHGMRQDVLDWIELNEAFAAQTLAVINTLELDPGVVNPAGGAIALGHPLGATGAIRSATLLHAMQREKLRYGMVTMCIGTGMGAAGLFENIR